MADLPRVELTDAQVEVMARVREEIEEAIASIVRPRSPDEQLADVAKMCVGYRVELPDGRTGTIVAAQSEWDMVEPHKVNVACQLQLDVTATAIEVSGVVE